MPADCKQDKTKKKGQERKKNNNRKDGMDNSLGTPEEVANQFSKKYLILQQAELHEDNIQKTKVIAEKEIK